MKKLIITWFGHSCFKIRYGEYSLVIDPYKDGMIPGLAPLALEADEVFCSHDHGDHSFVEAVKIRSPHRVSPFKVTKIRCAHDEVGGKKRGMNLIHVFEADGLRVAHFGDLGGRLTPQQMETLGRLDAAMIPVGGVFTIDAREAKELIFLLKPRVVIPMHYRTEKFGFGALGMLDDFLALCGDVMKAKSSSIEITEDKPKGTVVLTYEASN